MMPDKALYLLFNWLTSWLAKVNRLKPKNHHPSSRNIKTSRVLWVYVLWYAKWVDTFWVQDFGWRTSDSYL